MIKALALELYARQACDMQLMSGRFMKFGSGLSDAWRTVAGNTPSRTRITFAGLVAFSDILVHRLTTAPPE